MAKIRFIEQGEGPQRHASDWPHPRFVISDGELTQAGTTKGIGSIVYVEPTGPLGAGGESDMGVLVMVSDGEVVGYDRQPAERIFGRVTLTNMKI